MKTLVREFRPGKVAYTMNGAVPAPSKEEMEAGIAAYRELGECPQTVLFDLVVLLLARSTGVEPELHRWPELARELDRKSVV